jgi:hypothetical protein
VRADEETFDEFKGVNSGLCAMTIECRAHDVVKAFSEFFMVICEMCDEGVAVRQVMNGDSHDHADSREDDSIWR